MAIGSVSTVPYVAPLSTAKNDQPATDVTTLAIAQSPTLSSPPLLATATTAVLISEQGVVSPGTPAGLDLSGQDLRQVDLSKLDLKNANLKGANLSGKDLSGLDFSGANLSGADLSAATLTKTDLSSVTGDRVNLSGATLVGTMLDNANLKGAILAGAYIANVAADKSITNGVDVLATKNVDLTGADLSGAYLRNVVLEQASLKNANFNGAKMIAASIYKSDVDGASFRAVSGHVGILSSSARNVDFTHIDGTASVTLGGSRIEGATFEGSSFSDLFIAYSDARKVNLSVKDRDLSKATFGDANLSGMDFSGYNMSGTVFSSTPGAAVAGVNWTNGLDGTNFSGANMSGAQFYRQNASSANFTGANLANALIAGSLFEGNRSADLSKTRSAYAAPLSTAVSSSPLDVALKALSSMVGNLDSRYRLNGKDSLYNTGRQLS